ncbi:out at first protein-like [Arapaima gigas]
MLKDPLTMTSFCCTVCCMTNSAFPKKWKQPFDLTGGYTPPAPPVCTASVGDKLDSGIPTPPAPLRGGRRQYRLEKCIPQQILRYEVDVQPETALFSSGQKHAFTCAAWYLYHVDVSVTITLFPAALSGMLAERALLAGLLLSCAARGAGLGSELKVRVRLADGRLSEETLEADTQRDFITVEFTQGDGTLVTFIADFKQEVKIFRSLILGEMERGQRQYQVLCFITQLRPNELITSESMARLRQKNPRAVRTAEEQRGVEQLNMTVGVNLSQAWQLSTHIYNVCSDAPGAIYTRQVDAQSWVGRGVDGETFQALNQSWAVPTLQDCPSTQDLWQPCICHYSLRLEWYPCLLRYCRAPATATIISKGSSYRCGIRSCSKGYCFRFFVPYRQLCLWDEEDT